MSLRIYPSKVFFGSFGWEREAEQKCKVLCAHYFHAISIKCKLLLRPRPPANAATAHTIDRLYFQTKVMIHSHHPTVMYNQIFLTMTLAIFTALKI